MAIQASGPRPGFAFFLRRSLRCAVPALLVALSLSLAGAQCARAWQVTDLIPASSADADSMQRGLVQIIVISVNGKGQATISTGSGILLNGEGFVATNHHVVDGGRVFYVNPNGVKVSIEQVAQGSNAKVIAYDKNKDLAILKMEAVGALAPAVLSSVLPRKGEPVSAVGYPGIANAKAADSNDIVSDASVTRGVLSRARDDTTWGSGPVRTIQHSAAISWGSSGGPLMDDCSRVIGLNTQVATSDDRVRVAAAGYYWAVNIAELVEDLKARGIRYSIESNRCLAPTDILWRAIWVCGVVIALMFIVVIAAWRRPREKVIRIVERMSHYQRRPPASSDEKTVLGGALPRIGVTLEGTDPAGRHHSLRLTPAMLQAGAIIGREPPDPRLAIPIAQISREHVKIYWQDGAVCIRDLGSTNGTRVGKRAVTARRAEPLAHGDVVVLGPMSLRVTLST